MMKAAAKASGSVKLQDTMTLGDLGALLKQDAMDDAKAKAEEDGKEFNQTAGEMLAAAAIGMIEGKIKETAGTISETTKKLIADNKGSVITKWVTALDPQNTGKVDGATFSNVLMYENAQR